MTKLMQSLDAKPSKASKPMWDTDLEDHCYVHQYIAIKPKTAGGKTHIS